VLHGGASRRRGVRRAVLAGTMILPLALLAVACGGGGRDPGDDEEDHPVSTPRRLTTEHGQTVVTLDPATLARSGVAVEPLRPATHAASVTAYGSVLDLTGLAELRGGFTATATRLAKAHAAASASQAEFERLQTLYADGRNASQKALQAAAAKAKTDEAEVRAAEDARETKMAVARQQWGAVIAAWLEQGTPQLETLLQQKDRLLEITLPLGSPPPHPGTPVTVQAGAGPFVAGRVVAPAPRSDPRIQGASVLCTAPATPDMLSGVTVVARVPVGPGTSGVVVPASAVVWWQGRAWVYLEKGTGTFGRVDVTTDAPVPGGWFVTTGVAAGDRVVVRGAQTLLSEEGRGAVQGSEG
jgi:hypothetical protein